MKQKTKTEVATNLQITQIGTSNTFKTIQFYVLMQYRFNSKMFAVHKVQQYKNLQVKFKTHHNGGKSHTQNDTDHVKWGQLTAGQSDPGQEQTIKTRFWCIKRPATLFTVKQKHARFRNYPLLQ